MRRITTINDEKLAAARMGEPEQFSFKGWNGEKVHAYIVKPADFEEGKKYQDKSLVQSDVELALRDFQTIGRQLLLTQKQHRDRQALFGPGKVPLKEYEGLQ